MNEELATLVRAATVLENKLEAIDKEWKDTKAALDRLLEDDIPLMCDEFGITELKTAEFDLKVDDAWTASVPQYKKVAVCNAAIARGWEGLVKHKLVMEFNVGEKELLDQARDLLITSQQPFMDVMDINTGTLKKAVRETVSAGIPIDLQDFCVERTRLAIIKRR